ncbi:2-oxoisovalerate dehydrogenase subunit beta [Sulfolobales archaeon HS-7]|nr:2-oxoisovalerate dehydrogenase subunit beta [Sulfolobales archaeon HS-7]
MGMKANMVEALNNALNIIMDRDERAVILGEDVGTEGGVFRVTTGLKQKYGEHRVIDTPLAESTIIGMSIGLALMGLHPFPEIQFAGFSYVSFNQLVSHAARYRSRSRSSFFLPMVVRMPSGGGVKALEIHSENPETYYAYSQGLIILEPSTPYDAKGLLISASRLNDPVIFLEPLKLYRLFREEIPEEPYEVPIGRANILRKGNEVTIVTYGPTVPDVLKVVDKKKVDAEVIDLRSIVPLDEKTILDSVKKTGRVMIVHQAPLSFGVGAEIAARISEKAIYSLEAPIVRIASPSIPYPFPGYEDYYIPDERRIEKGLDKLMSA